MPKRALSPRPSKHRVGRDTRCRRTRTFSPLLRFPVRCRGVGRCQPVSLARCLCRPVRGFSFCARCVSSPAQNTSAKQAHPLWAVLSHSTAFLLRPGLSRLAWGHKLKTGDGKSPMYVHFRRIDRYRRLQADQALPEPVITLKLGSSIVSAVLLTRAAASSPRARARDPVGAEVQRLHSRTVIVALCSPAPASLIWLL